MINDLSKYIEATCVNPKKVRIYDPFAQQYVVQQVPCGNCIHCKMQKVNEWITRLYSQKNYSKYVYYISLDYAPFDISSPVAALLAAETGAAEHNINKYGKHGLHPVVLCKNHFADFHKRLRKNTGVHYQYFGCGEYGTAHSRPHFHIIIFSNSPITRNDIQKAWTIKGYKIGRVDYNDLVENGTTSNDKSNPLNCSFVFRYVCKYLFKKTGIIDKLKTYEYHKKYFESLYQEIKGIKPMSSPKLCDFGEMDVCDPITPEQRLYVQYWKEYCKEYSPFIACSRRPAIGLQYLQDNLSRFKDADFRLFGLPKDVATFPRYYMRKTKEMVCPFKALGEVTSEPSSNSRMLRINTLLHEIQDSRLSLETWSSPTAPIWCKNGDKLIIKEGYNDPDPDTSRYIKNSELSFYSTTDNILYSFNGYDYSLWCKLKNGSYYSLGRMAISNAISLIETSVFDLYDTFIRPFRTLKLRKQKELEEYIKIKYEGDHDKFNKAVYQHYQQMIDTQRKKDIIIENSHQTF